MIRAFFLNFVYLGHIYPTLPIIRELKARGVSVTAYGLEDHLELISDNGTITRPYASPPEPEENAMQLAAYNTRWAAVLLPGILRDIERDQPDFIISDSMLPLGWYVARITNLPLIVFTTHYVAKETITDAIGLDDFMRQGDTGTYEDDLVAYRQAAEELQTQLGVKALNLRDTFQIPGDLTIVTTSSALQPASELLDETFKFVGPMIEVRNSAPDFPFEQIDGHTTIYISMGTMASNSEFFQMCGEAFANAPYRVVISTGGKDVSLADLPVNIFLRRYVPQLELLQRVDAFVTHGGWNSINEALYYDVPLIVCPQGKDQFSNAGMIERIGAGKVLMDITPKKLRAAVNDVLADQTYGQRAKDIGHSLRSAGGATRAVSEILAFMQPHTSGKQ
jgi:MGT family glycosyltransferase